ncbi:hypothetical protein [Paenibacillus xerothermodurans]|uniref:Nitrile hydratase subunit beta n=1 Tax=Paenibacillus xerothermodurans TaxID=1977292 RepID=A0A2W1NMH1_PAEXE|nr:hypothetical protein [Paenibacillus xerothermodurans]PZE19056.1 hypothetical protein CBW46_020355 [Paenibacillus xerothermodurans]
MNPIPTHLQQIDLIGKLADLKHAHYQSALLVSTIIELLVEKGIITAQDIASVSAKLDASYTPQHDG